MTRFCGQFDLLLFHNIYVTYTDNSCKMVALVILVIQKQGGANKKSPEKTKRENNQLKSVIK